MNLLEKFKKYHQSEDTLIGNFTGPINVTMCMAPLLQRSIIKDVLSFLDTVNFNNFLEVLLSGEVILLKKLDDGTLEVYPERGGRKFLLAQLKNKELTQEYTVIYEDDSIGIERLI